MSDIDGNGSIDKNEMMKVLEAIHQLHNKTGIKQHDLQKRLDAIFTIMDKNKDGESNADTSLTRLFCRKHYI